MSSSSLHWTDSMANDRGFFVALGKRIAQLRKEQGWTQQTLADELGVAQQTLAHYEGARLRLPASLLTRLVRLFGVGVDELIGDSVPGRAKRGPAPRLAQHIERIGQLSKLKQKFVMEMLETVLNQASR